jgi:uncharacterized protein YjbI with pentapeptide repeats
VFSFVPRCTARITEVDLDAGVDGELTVSNLTGANLSGAYLFDATLTGVISGDITGTPGELPIGWQLINGALVEP